MQLRHKIFLLKISEIPGKITLEDVVYSVAEEIYERGEASRATYKNTEELRILRDILHDSGLEMTPRS